MTSLAYGKGCYHLVSKPKSRDSIDFLERKSVFCKKPFFQRKKIIFVFRNNPRIRSPRMLLARSRVIKTFML